MAELTLEKNQAAVVLTADEGNIEVDIAFDHEEGLAGQICKALAMKLIQDEAFREDLLGMITESQESA